MIAFSLRLGVKQRYVFSLSWKHCTRCSAQCNKTRIKGKQIGKEKVNISLVADDIFGFVENLKKSIEQLLEQIKFLEGFRIQFI